MKCVYKQINQDVWKEFWDQVEDRVSIIASDKVDRKMWNPIRDQVWYGVRDHLWDQIYE